MSSIRVTLPFLAVKPRVRKRDGALTARASLFLRTISLFAYDRYLRVDIESQLIWFLTRRWWLLTTVDAVHFPQAKYVIYKYTCIPTSYGFVPEVDVTDSVGWFDVALAIEHRTDPLKLFRFFGESSEMTGAVGAIFGDDPYDFEGDQEIASRDFVTHLTRLIGIPLRTELEKQVSDIVGSRMVSCPHCGRPVSPVVTRCVYCARSIARASATPREVLRRRGTARSDRS